MTPESLADQAPVGPDPERYVSAIREYVDAGIENVYIHQVDDGLGAADAWEEILPAAPGVSKVGATTDERRRAA